MLIPQEQPEHVISSDQNMEWTHQLTFHSTKFQNPAEQIKPDDPEFVESVDKFIELGSRVVITVSTAWWAMCEFMDYIKLRTAQKEKRLQETDVKIPGEPVQDPIRWHNDGTDRFRN